jgi:hypothetical protein
MLMSFETLIPFEDCSVFDRVNLIV